MTGELTKTGRSIASTCRFWPFRGITLLFDFFMMFSPCQARGENTDYEEIDLTVRVQGVGSFNVNALYVYDSRQLLRRYQTLIGVCRPGVDNF